MSLRGKIIMSLRGKIIMSDYHYKITRLIICVYIIHVYTSWSIIQEIHFKVRYIETMHGIEF